MCYIEGVDRNQSLMFSQLVDDYIKDDNPVRFIDAYVESLDLVKLGFTHTTTKDTGREPYNPRDLLKLKGHYQYYGIRCNYRSLVIVFNQTIRI